MQRHQTSLFKRARTGTGVLGGISEIIGAPSQSSKGTTTKATQTQTSDPDEPDKNDPDHDAHDNDLPGSNSGPNGSRHGGNTSGSTPPVSVNNTAETPPAITESNAAKTSSAVTESNPAKAPSSVTVNNPAKTRPAVTENNTAKTPSAVTESNVAKTPPPLTVTKSTPQNHASTTASPTVPIGVLIGVVLAAVIITGVALVVCYFRVLKRRRIARLVQPMAQASTENGAPSALILPQQPEVEPYMFPESDTVDAAPENSVTSEISIQRSSITKGSQRDPPSPLSTSTVNIDPVSVQRENRSNGRRAVDAGPVLTNVETEEEDDLESTLPPDYMDVFSMSRSASTVSSRM